MFRLKTKSAISPYRFIASLLLLAVVSTGLLIARIVSTNSFRFSFLFWNLFLAALPVLIAWWLVTRIQSHGWLKWQQIVLSVIWLGFLPNSFYLITDLIHLRSNYEADLLFDINLLVSFILCGILLGYASVYMIHRQLLSRISEWRSYGIVGLVFLASSFAICLGRYTRWNTWDILLQPAGLLYDVSDRLLNPGVHLQTYQTTVTIFLMLFSVYIVIWEAARVIRQK